jgi:hypothetical protein
MGVPVRMRGTEEGLELREMDLHLQMSLAGEKQTNKTD